MKKYVFIVAFFCVCTSANAQIFKPLDQMSDVERSVFLAEHFWDGFPFNDTNVLHQDRFRGSVKKYLEIISLADLKTIQKSLVETLKKTDTNERMYRFFVESFDFYLNDALSDIREEQWIVPVWQHMLTSKWCTFADSTRINFYLQMAAKNPVGAIATDLDFTTIQGKNGKLSDVEAEMILLYFYIPGCQQCKMTIEWIAEDTAYQQLIKAGVLQGLAFYPEKNMELFQKYQSTIPRSWINARDPDGMSQLEDDGKYQMRGAPTMYLLDKNKKIILKDARIDLLFNEFAKAQERYLKR